MLKTGKLLQKPEFTPEDIRYLQGACLFLMSVFGGMTISIPGIVPAALAAAMIFPGQDRFFYFSQKMVYKFPGLVYDG